EQESVDHTALRADVAARVADGVRTGSLRALALRRRRRAQRLPEPRGVGLLEALRLAAVPLAVAPGMRARVEVAGILVVAVRQAVGDQQHVAARLGVARGLQERVLHRVEQRLRGGRA